MGPQQAAIHSNHLRDAPSIIHRTVEYRQRNATQNDEGPPRDRASAMRRRAFSGLAFCGLLVGETAARIHAPARSGEYSSQPSRVDENGGGTKEMK
jgi:hypothetical protein